MCNVIVGDYCVGKVNAPTPDPRPDNQNATYDSTVNDIDDPILFVTFNDAQAYPAYLLEFDSGVSLR